MSFRIRSILVGSDSSEAAREVLRTASAFASLAGSELHVIYAAEDVQPANPQMSDPVELAAEQLRREVRLAIPQEGGLTSLRIVPGAAHEVILQRAHEVSADLVVIGPHRRTTGEDGELGTTADMIVRTSEQPCLVVRAPVSLPLRSVLVPTDLSDAAQGALDLALSWTAALRLPTSSGEVTRLEVLHVLSGPTAVTDADSALADEVAAAEERTGSADLLKVNRTIVEADSAADEILARTDDMRPDLLVMGTHGESAAARSSIGSVSSEVARRASCTLLLAPPGWWQVQQARERMLNGGSPGAA